MSLWWLQPGWKQTLCADCGVNIWNSGGDPDHGVCYDCFNRRYDERQRPEPTDTELCAGYGHTEYENSGRCYCGALEVRSRWRFMGGKEANMTATKEPTFYCSSCGWSNPRFICTICCQLFCDVNGCKAADARHPCKRILGAVILEHPVVQALDGKGKP